MAVATLQVYIDFANDGAFDVSDEVTANVMAVSWTRGRNADFSGDATGEATIVLTNATGTYSPATNANMVPGRPVHIRSTYSAVTRPHFYGFIQRISPNAKDRTVTITVHDPLQKMAETDILVPLLALRRSAREFRIAVLEDFERGSRNLILNPSFEAGAVNWVVTGGTITPTFGDHATGTSGSYCGEFVPTSNTHILKNYARLAPGIYASQVYRFAVWLRTTSGTSDWVIELATAAALASKTVTLTTTWTRHTLTALPTADYRTSDQPLVAQIYSVAAGGGTVRVDGAQVTRGAALQPYSDVGTGRWPNLVGNGSFDGQVLTGWRDAYKNLLANPSFETNTTGWVVTADAFHSAGTSVTRSTTAPKFGTAAGLLTVPIGAGTSGMHVVVSGTFLAGVAYTASVWVRDVTGADDGSDAGLQIGSQGTPTDCSAQVVLGGGGITGTYQKLSVTWVPSANRSDVHFDVLLLGLGGSTRSLYVDGAMLVQMGSAPTYFDTGPGGGGGVPITSLGGVAQAKYGTSSLTYLTPATATAGYLYDFNHVGAYFMAGQTYRLSVWIRGTSSYPYKIGMAANKGDGTFDEASTTGTATANTWTNVQVPWTPTADRSAANALDVVLYIYQTDATSRTAYIDGVRVISDVNSDEFEMAQWVLTTTGEGNDLWTTAATASGTALGVLSQFNNLTLTRHYVRATMASPWYEYVTTSRDDIATKTSQETFNDDFLGFSDADLDRDSIVNTVEVTWASSGFDYYSDSSSVGAYGQRLGPGIDGSAYYPDRTIPNRIGTALVTRYKDPRSRPSLTVKNRFTSQLVRALDDRITVNLARLGISGGSYLIVREETSVSEGGKYWTTTYHLEDFPA